MRKQKPLFTEEELITAMKIIGAMIFASLLTFLAMSDNYDIGYQDGVFDVSLVLFNKTSLCGTSVNLYFNNTSRTLYTEDCDSFKFSNEVFGALKFAPSPEPLEFGTKCLGDYKVKINETFIGCAK